MHNDLSGLFFSVVNSNEVKKKMSKMESFF